MAIKGVVSLEVVEHKLGGAGLPANSEQQLQSVLVDLRRIEAERLAGRSASAAIEVYRRALSQVRELAQSIPLSPKRFESLISLELYVRGGKATSAAEFPECVAVHNSANDRYDCSGVLLTPEWLLTVDHCTRADKIFAGVNLGKNGKEYSLVAGEGVSDGALRLYKLDSTKGLPAVGQIPLASECALSAGTVMTAVAFGSEDAGAVSAGLQRRAPFKLEADVQADARTITVAAFGTAVCPGDSGGPLYMQSAANQRSLLAVAEEKLVVTCAAGGSFSRLSPARAAWIEKHTGSLPRLCPAL